MCLLFIINTPFISFSFRIMYWLYNIEIEQGLPHLKCAKWRLLSWWTKCGNCSFVLWKPHAYNKRCLGGVWGSIQLCFFKIGYKFTYILCYLWKRWICGILLRVTKVSCCYHQKMFFLSWILLWVNKRVMLVIWQIKC